MNDDTIGLVYKTARFVTVGSGREEAMPQQWPTAYRISSNFFSWELDHVIKAENAGSPSVASDRDREV
jgi:hypothetical protein